MAEGMWLLRQLMWLDQVLEQMWEKMLLEVFEWLLALQSDWLMGWASLRELIGMCRQKRLL